jgi:hypothetical protein
MAVLIVSIVALLCSIATTAMVYLLFRKHQEEQREKQKEKQKVHSYWPCFRCGRPVALHGDEVNANTECSSCQIRNR